MGLGGLNFSKATLLTSMRQPILSRPQPRNCMNLSGESQSQVGVLVEVDPRYFRPTEVDLLIGDASKARAKLGGRHRVSFDELVAEMVAVLRKMTPSMNRIRTGQRRALSFEVPDEKSKMREFLLVLEMGPFASDCTKRSPSICPHTSRKRPSRLSVGIG